MSSPANRRALLDALDAALLVIASAGFAVGIDSIAWAFALLAAAVATVEATTGFNAATALAELLRRRRLARAARTTSRVTAPNTTIQPSVAAADAPLGFPVARTASARSTPLRNTARGPAGDAVAPPPKHGQGTCCACARTSTTVNARSMITAATAGNPLPGTTTSAIAIAISTTGTPTAAMVPTRAPSSASICVTTWSRSRSLASAAPASASARTTRAASATALTAQLSYRPYPPR